MADVRSFNKAILQGRVTKEVKSKETKTKGTKVARFVLATNEIYQGQKEVHEEFHHIVCFGRLAEFAIKYAKVGNPFLVEGKIRNRSWRDEQGNYQSITEIAAEQIIAQFSLKKEDERQSIQKEENKRPGP